MNYEPLYTFAEKHRVPYNELCTALRAALAAPQPEPVALCDALRWSGAKESHGAMMFSPNQLRKFYEFASRAAPPAAPAPADMVMVPRNPVQASIGAGVVALYEASNKDFEASGSEVAVVYRAMTAAAHAVQPLTDEQDRALCEAYCNTASDEYFGARPQLDSAVNRRIFYAGHRKAWMVHGIGTQGGEHG